MAFGTAATKSLRRTLDREVLDALQKAKARAQGVPAILDQTVNELALTIDENVIEAEIVEDTRDELSDLY